MAQRRVLYYDVLNVIACFGVVALHFNTLVYAYSPTFDWRQALSTDCLFYWAVPIFFMLTGATLLGYREKYDTRTFFLRRAHRVLVPFLAWSVIALVWKVATGQMAAPAGPRSFLQLVFNAKIIDAYWFFIPLFMIYLCLPVLTELRSNRRALWYLASLAFVFNVAVPSLCTILGMEHNPDATVPMASGYLLYALLGYLLKDAELDRKARCALYAAGVVAYLVRFLGTIALSDAAGALNETFWGYQNLTCFFEAVAVFVFARNVRWDRLFGTERAQQGLAQVASCSFGVYLIHMFAFWYGLLLTGLQGADLLWRTAGPVVAYALCLTIVWIAKRIPLIRTLFP